MSRAGILILLGILTILTPFSGLPIALRTVLSVIFGLCVFSIGLSLRLNGVRTTQSSVAVPMSEVTNVSLESTRRDPQDVSVI
jgi:hypothetical protein